MARLSRKTGLTVLAALLIVGGITAWAVSRPSPQAITGDPTDLSDVVLVVGTPNKTGLRRQLLASGEAENLPYKVEWAVFDSTPPLTEALKAGKVDIGGGGETGVLFALANGARIKILAANIAEDVDSKSEVLVRGDSPINSIADLRGRKIALPYYTAQHYQLARALDKENIPWDRKLILNLNTVDGLSALVNRQVDAFVVWDPNAAIAEVQFGARGIASLRNVAPTAGVLYAAEASVEDPRKKRALQDLVRRIIRAQAWVDRNPQQWANDIATNAQIPLEAALLSVKRGGSRYAPVTDADVLSRWQQEIDYFHKQGLFRQRFDISDHIAPEFEETVRDESARVAAKEQKP